MNERHSAYLGISPEGKIVPYINQGELNPIGPRWERGTSLPGSCYLVFEKDRQVTPEEFMTCLEELQVFCDKVLNKPKKKK